MIIFNHLALSDASWKVIWGSENPEAILLQFPSPAYAYAFASHEAAKWLVRDHVMYEHWTAVKQAAWLLLHQN